METPVHFSFFFLKRWISHSRIVIYHYMAVMSVPCLLWQPHVYKEQTFLFLILCFMHINIQFMILAQLACKGSVLVCHSWSSGVQHGKYGETRLFINCNLLGKRVFFQKEHYQFVNYSIVNHRFFLQRSKFAFKYVYLS